MKGLHKIGIGSVQFGIKYGISNQNGKTSESEVKEILKVASDNKIRIIDTASAYGDSEIVLGKNELKDFKIVSKFMPPSTDSSITNQLKKSLNNLNLNSLYGYLAHRPYDLLKNPHHWEELEYLKSIKQIQKIGFSLNTTDELDTLLEKNLNPDLIQVPYNYFDKRFKSLITTLHKKGCEIHTRSTFLQGIFFIEINTAPSFFDSIKSSVTVLQNKYGTNLSSALLNYVLKQPFIDCVIIGVENKDQLLQNLSSLDNVEVLTEHTSAIPEKILMPSMWPTDKI